MAWKDLAARVLRAGVRTFDAGDVTYKPPGGSVAYSVQGVFDGPHEQVDLDTGVPLDSTAPMLGIRLDEFVEKVGVEPEQNGAVTIGTDRYEVRSVEPDGQGGADLVLELLS